MRGFWADERVDGKLWELKHPIYRTIYNYFKRKEKQFLKEADAIVSLTHTGLNEMLTWDINSLGGKTKVIPCCVNLDYFNPAIVNSAIQTDLKHNLGIDPETKILGYVGSIGTWYMLEEMLDFYAVYRTQQSRSSFLFISAEPKERILEVSRMKGIPENEIVVQAVAHKEVSAHVALFDLSVFFILPSYSKKASSPTKQGELMAMGIPIVCNNGVGDTAELIKKYSAGSVVDEFNENAYLQAIHELTTFDKTEAMKGANEYFSLVEGVRRYNEIYTHLLG
jgi:glycosyltransferase involved in cell wall biosynthesis